MSRIVLFANGELPDPESARALIQPDDFILCADGGTRHALALGLTPHLVIGDFDSLDPAMAQRLAQEGVTLQRFPRDKDYTDLELALQAAEARHPKKVLLLAALGGRLDQTLANVFLLAHPRYRHLPVTLVHGPERAWVVDQSITLYGQPGDLVSVLPLTPEVHGLTYTGLRWHLRQATLFLGSSRGVSNQMVGHQAHITLRSGVILVIHRAAPSLMAHF